jgi:hypothetical protein
MTCFLMLPRFVTTGLPHGFHHEPAEASPPVVAELNNSICFQTFKGYQAHFIIVAMSSSFPAVKRRRLSTVLAGTFSAVVRPTCQTAHSRGRPNCSLLNRGSWVSDFRNLRYGCPRPSQALGRGCADNRLRIAP